MRNRSEVELQIVEMKKVRAEIGPASEFLQAHIKGSLRVHRIRARTGRSIRAYQSPGQVDLLRDLHE